MRSPFLLIAIALFLTTALAACGDDGGETANNGASNNGDPNNGDPNNGDPNNGAPNNGAPNNGAPNNGTPNNGTPNNGNNGNNGTPNNGNNGNNGDPVAQCLAFCDRLAMCEELVEACGAETTQTLRLTCRDDACADEPTRDQIDAIRDLPCSIIVPQAIAGFGVEDECELVPTQTSVPIVVTSDYQTSEVWAVFGTDTEQRTRVATGTGDVSVSKLDADSFAVVDRQAGVVSTFTLTDGVAAPGWTATTGEGTNPHAAAHARDGAHYITRYAAPSLLVVDNDGVEIDTIDLSNRFDDGVPEMDLLFVAGGRAYVILQNLEDFAPAGSSQVAVIDTTNDTVVTYVDLGCQNAFAATWAMGRIYIACTGNFGERDGQVVALDPLDNSVEAGIFTESDVDGDLLAIARGADGWFVASSNDDFSNNLTHLGEGANTVLIDGGVVGGLARAATIDRVVVCDGSGPGGLLLFDAGLDNAEPTGPIGVGDFPPRQVIILE